MRKELVNQVKGCTSASSFYTRLVRDIAASRLQTIQA